MFIMPKNFFIYSNMTALKIAIIGAGPAGMMAAIQLKELGIESQIFDSQNKIGKKIIISGGGRCNITNKDMSVSNFNSQEAQFVKKILKAFPLKSTLDFFDKQQVALKLEDDFGKYFPASNKSKDILQAFLLRLQELKIPILKNHEVLKITRNSHGFDLHFNDKETVFCDKVILSTGGLSLPKTGSNGSGYKLSKSLGHSTTETFPGLTPLINEDPRHQSLTGLSLKCCLSLYINNKKKTSFVGPLLFTHFGYSGPVILNISRHFIASKSETKKIEADWLSNTKEDTFKLESIKKKYDKWSLQKYLNLFFQKSFSLFLLEESNIPPTLKFADIKKEEFQTLKKNIFHFPLPITNYRSYNFAEVTCGGIPTTEINVQNLESRICPNLHFCGEIMNVEGQLGGYNFQWAFASAYTLAKGIHKKLFNN